MVDVRHRNRRNGATRLGRALALAVLMLPGAASAQDVALTFDDLPAHSVLPPGETRLGVVARLVAALADAGAPATGFVNAAGLETRPEERAVLEVWRAAGHPLGNHGWSHANLDAIGADVFATELVRNEPVLQSLAGDSDWRWFRYPFLAEGQTPDVRRAARAALRERGYKVASVTMDFSDWAFSEPWARCRSKGDAVGMARLETLFLTSAEEALTASRTQSRALYGRDIPYVLLMHVGALDAHMMPRLLALYQARGVRLVTLEAAMADPFYDADRTTADGPGPLSLETAAAAAGLPRPARTDVQSELAGLCR
ncbi:polysaccharide deacetylase [Brevundimonas sp. LM2]|uniref:polysaccharide deacetylase family protein n=1 Tax=Brevundimonas sp. LM2 TaxID=1938605 RepID=UPI000983C8B7|nr:polysaccharide deacetylase family protein [Brevundimonas sp. LM2]AQR61115.1 polysaccharide deacetylase [Brevundimonas sp. LM2]